MKVADLIASLSRLPPDAEAPASSFVPGALVPDGFMETHFIPGWALIGEEAEVALTEAIETTWPYPTASELLAEQRPACRFDFDLDVIWRHGDVGHAKAVQQLCDGGDGRLCAHFDVRTPLSYLDLATRTVVLCDGDDDLGDRRVISVDLAEFVEEAHSCMRVMLCEVLAFDPEARALIPPVTMTIEEAFETFRRPAGERRPFRLTDKPKLYAALDAAYKAFSEARENRDILSAYREAGGVATNANMVIGKLRGALGLTRESLTQREAVQATLDEARSVLAGNFAAIEALRYVRAEDVVSRMYR